MASDDTIIRIGGDASGGVAAATQVGTAIRSQAIPALQEMTAQMRTAADAMKLLSDYAKLAGDSAAAGAKGYLDASTSAAEYQAKLQMLRAQLELTQAQQAEMTAQLSGGGGAISAMGGFASGTGEAISQVKGMAEALAGLLILQTVIGWFNDLTEAVKGAADQIFELSTATQRNVFMWQYQFANGNKRDPQIAQQLAEFTARFSFNAPFTRQDINTGIGALGPTGLNLKGIEKYAPMIADLASTHASIFGTGGQLTFSQVSFALMEAMTTGNARRMMMELQIHPRDLEKYGVKFAGHGAVGGQILNPWEFMPAMLKLTAAKGYTGAAQAAAHETFWGEMSSFQDRLQNLALEIGGGGINGVPKKGSPFGQLQAGLEGISSWMDSHKAQLFNFADLISNRVGGAFATLAGLVGQASQGLQQSGLADLLQGLFGQDAATIAATQLPTRAKGQSAASYQRQYGAAKRLDLQMTRQGQADKRTDGADPTTLQSLAKALGDLAANAKKAGDFIGGFMDKIDNSPFMQWFQSAGRQELGDLAQAFQDLGSSITPEEKANLLGLLAGLGLISGSIGLGVIKVITWLVEGFTQLNTWAQNAEQSVLGLKDGLKRFGDTIGGIPGKLDTLVTSLKLKGVLAGLGLVNGIIQGIGDLMPNLQQVIANIATQIGSILPGGGGKGSSQASIRAVGTGGQRVLAGAGVAHVTSSGGGRTTLSAIGNTTNTSHSSVTIVQHGVPGPYMEHTVQKIRREEGKKSFADMRAPGYGAARFGAIG